MRSLAEHILTYLLSVVTPSHPATNNTVYIAQVNNHEAVCSYVQRDKGCYNMLKCNDGSTYFCVQNVEQRIDR